MSKRHALLIGGTKMVERHLRAALPADMDLAVLRSMEQAMRRMEQQPVQLLVFGPTMRRSLAMVGTLRRDKARLGVGLVVVYRDDQRSDVQRHSGGQHTADAYIMQSKASRELKKTIEATLARVDSGLGVVSDLLEELPMEALSPMTGDVSSAAVAAAEEPLELIDLEDIEMVDDDGADDGESATQMLDLAEIDAALDDDTTIDGDLIEEIDVEIGPFDGETETDLDGVSAGLIEEIAAEEVVDLSDVAEVIVEDLELDDIEELEEIAPQELEELVMSDELEELSADELIEDVSADELIEDLIADEVIEDLSADEVVEDLSADEVVEDLSADEVVEDLSADEVVEDLSADEVVEDLSADEVVEAVDSDAASEPQAEQEPLQVSKKAEKPAEKAEETSPKSTPEAEAKAANSDAKQVASTPTAEPIPPRKERNQSSSQFMAENLSELTKMLGTLQAATTEIGRLEQENEELTERIKTLTAGGGQNDLQTKLDEVSAAKRSAETAVAAQLETIGSQDKALAAAEVQAAQQRAKLSAAVEASQAAQERASVAESRVAALEAELEQLRQTQGRQAASIAAASALLNQAASHLSGPDVAPVDRS
ncbi:MAG: hypothetical protein KC502_00775 [Myxococcales bacterium]|nr:hypothetical protein [Myxococcales bacterium]